jgi:hypothetical protein
MIPQPTPSNLDRIEHAWRAMAAALKRGHAEEAEAFMQQVRDLRAEEPPTITHDPALHCLHSKSHSAAASSRQLPSSSDVSLDGGEDHNTATLDPVLHCLHSRSRSATRATPSAPRGFPDPATGAYSPRQGRDRHECARYGHRRL